MGARAWTTLGMLGLCLPEAAWAAPGEEPRPSYVEKGWLGRDVRRGGFHFQISFGFGGGPDTEGVFHAMEIGGTLRNGVTLGMIHTFIQNKGIARDKGGPDLIGGWLFEVKAPLGRPELVAKVAFGPGGIHHQEGGRIRAVWGPAWTYGLDVHLAVTGRSGPTLTVAGLHAIAEGQHHVGFAGALGYTVF